MSDELSLGAIIFTGIFGLFGYSAKRNITTMDKKLERHDTDLEYLKKSDSDCKLDLANFRTEVARDYSKDVNIQASLKRVYEVMEHGFSEQREYFKDMLHIKEKK